MGGAEDGAREGPAAGAVTSRRRRGHVGSGQGAALPCRGGHFGKGRGAAAMLEAGGPAPQPPPVSPGAGGGGGGETSVSLSGRACGAQIPLHRDKSEDFVLWAASGPRPQSLVLVQ